MFISVLPVHKLPELLKNQAEALKKDKQRKQELAKAAELEQELRQLRDAMQASQSCFDEVTDPCLTDALIYERASIAARYSFITGELRRIIGGAHGAKKQGK